MMLSILAFEGLDLDVIRLKNSKNIAPVGLCIQVLLDPVADLATMTITALIFISDSCKT
jgi:hypothetical protein